MEWVRRRGGGGILSIEKLKIPYLGKSAWAALSVPSIVYSAWVNTWAKLGQLLGQCVQGLNVSMSKA